MCWVGNSERTSHLVWRVGKEIEEVSTKVTAEMCVCVCVHVHLCTHAGLYLFCFFPVHIFRRQREALGYSLGNISYTSLFLLLGKFFFNEEFLWHVYSLVVKL